MTPSAGAVVARAIQTALDNDQALKDAGVTAVYSLRAPEEAAAPFVVYQQVSAPREYTYKQLARVGVLVQVKVVDAGESAKRARDIDQRVDELLTDVAMTLDAPWRWLGTRREMDLPEMPVLDQGQPFVQVGGDYRVTVTK